MSRHTVFLQIETQSTDIRPLRQVWITQAFVDLRCRNSHMANFQPEPEFSHTAMPSWKMAEKIAAAFEQALAPSARVEHNVRLPVIGKLRKRQCDVVITYGAPPRQSLTIVEVQKRKSKPGLTMFHGWIEKMREVGAQNLICVSAQGFPPSVVDEVLTKYGPTVKLLTLKELERGNAFDILQLEYFFLKYLACRIVDAGPVTIKDPPNVLPEIRPQDKIFQFEGFDDLLDLSGLALKAVDEVSSQILSSDHPVGTKFELVFDEESKHPNLWAYLGSAKYQVIQLDLRIELEIQAAQIPSQFFTYHQETIDGALAWIGTANTNYNGREISVQVVFKKGANGVLRLESVSCEGTKGFTLYIFPDEIAAKKAMQINFGRDKI
jgi:hypothetical protein